MALLGKLVKSAIQLGHQFTFKENPNPAETQRDVLRDLLEKAQDTAFGKYYDFAGILRSDDPGARFAATVPLHDYHALYDRWWHRQRDGAPDITWPGRTRYFARSSGTTGGPSKYIPVTQDMIDTIRRTGIQMVLSLGQYELPEDLFETEILMLGSSTNLDENGQFVEGEISGISAGNIPGWFEGYYRPGREISDISDWHARVERIAEQAPEWNIGALSGIPSWMHLMLERIVERHKLKNIHEIWPNLTLYASGGIALEPYRRSLEKLMARPLIYLDTYLASEGFVAYQARPNDKMAMQLAFESGIYFEFIPFDEQHFPEGQMSPQAQTLHIGQVQEGVDYALLLSTCAGTWRYLIGDTVRFTNVSRGEIVVTGRTKHFLSITGEQLSVDNMTQGVEQLAAAHNVHIPEFTVAALPDGDHFLHRWYLGVEGNLPTDGLSDQLDQLLHDLNHNYGVARTKGLRAVEVEVVSPELFYQWHTERQKAGGQTKTSRVMKAEQFEQWEAFVRQHQVDKDPTASVA